MSEPTAAGNTGSENLAATKAPEGVRRMFHDIAPHYDFLNRLLSLRIDCAWRRFTARTVLRDSDRRILDMCGGTGDLALAFAERAADLATQPAIISADFTAAMTRIAQQKFGSSSGSRTGNDGKTAPTLVPMIGDTLNIPFGDDCFDVVAVAFGIRNVSDLHRGLAEMFRTCKPGGRVAILEFSHPRQPLLRSLYFWYFFRVLPRIGQLISGTRAYSYLSESVATFPDTKEFVEILKQHGHGPVHAHRLTFGISTLYVAEKEQAQLRPPISAQRAACA